MSKDNNWQGYKARRLEALQILWDSGHRLKVEDGLLVDSGEPKQEFWKHKRQAKEAAMKDITPKKDDK